ncbi:hypothetical protein TNCV_1396351 [Trichonephila clavipes]|nr:hypothetical protein TNCV_1396351 [Trichonephila clavipes]
MMKSKGIIPSGPGDHAIGPSLPIHRPRNIFLFQTRVTMPHLRSMSCKFKSNKLCYRSPVAEWLVHRDSSPQVRGLNPELIKVDSTFPPFKESIKENQACLGT